jgi:hypothetical protein
MKRECTRCHRAFTPSDLERAESRHMESERKAAGIAGVRFVSYHCPDCAMTDIFVDILPRPDEFQEDYESRRAAMEDVARRLHTERAEAVVVPVGRP